MDFQLENNLRNNPAILIGFLWNNNPDAIRDRLATYGFSEVDSLGDVINALADIYDEQGVAGVQNALTINLIMENLTAREVAAVENLATVTPPTQRNWGPGESQLNPDQFANDFDSSPETQTGDGNHGSGQGWQVVASVLDFAGVFIDNVFGEQSPGSPQPGATPQQQPNDEGAKWPLYIGIALLVIAVFVVIALLVKKKK